jgi:hypothetical protein
MSETSTSTEQSSSAETEGSATFDRSTLLKVGVGFVVAVALLYLFGRVIGWNEIFRTMANAKLRWLAAAFASTVVCLAVWTKGWDVILSVVDVSIPFGELTVMYFAATFTDYITPFGKAGGGPFIAYILSTHDEADYQDSLVSVLITDTLNLVPYFTFAALGFVGLTVTGNLPDRARLLVWGLGTLMVVIPVLVVVVWRYEQKVEALVVRVLSPVAERTDRVDLDSLRNRIREFYDNLEYITDHPRPMAHTLAYSFVGWIFFALPLYFAGLTLGLAIDPLMVLFIVPASSLASFVPTPGGTGAVEAALVALLVALTAANPHVAAAVTLVYRVASYWLTVAVGGLAAFYVIYRA